jgi:hypothetical protein
VFDKVNKRIFAYPIQLTGHDTRKGCETAHYEVINTDSFYMWDENKQLWEVKLLLKNIKPQLKSILLHQ